MSHRLIVATIVLVLLLPGCATNRGDTVEEKRQAVLEMRSKVLEDLYGTKQSARAEVSEAPGYAVFSNANVNVIFASFSGGYGVVHDNSTQKDTYMRMGEFGVGLGVGAKDYRLVFVFHDQAALTDFLQRGWSFGGQADAAAKAGDMGGAVGGEAVFERVSIYQLTESGLALQATVKGTRFYQDPDLN